ncbi:hypothetical protein QE152_g6311 [Popillia japonica]|uniref:Uncharacterized protein n=1 Tax=Popillia japonica TaxID=7064 RepID=A0AAW1MJC2_POPJA
MLAAAFEEEIQEFAESTKINVPLHLDLLDLYEKFIDRKYIGYVLHDRDSRDIAEMLAGGVNLRKVHQFLALDVLYPRHKHDFPQPKRFHALPPEKLNKIGIAEYIGTKPRFIHRTFAEYFAADLLTDRFSKEHSHLDSFQIIFLDKILLGDESRVVRSFLDRLLERNPPCSEHLQRYGRKMVELHQQNRNGESTNPKFKPCSEHLQRYGRKMVELHQQNRNGESTNPKFKLLERDDFKSDSPIPILTPKSTKIGTILGSQFTIYPWQWIALHNNLNLLEIAENLAENHHLNLQEDLFLAKDNLGRNLAHWMFHYATSPSLNRFYSLAKSAQIDLKSFLHSTDNSGRNVWYYAVWNQDPNILEKLWSISQEFGLDFPPDILYKSNLIQSGSLDSLDSTWSLIKRSQIDLKSFFAYPSANPLHLAAENVDQKILPKLLDYIKEADPDYNLLKILSFTKYGNHNLWSLILVNNDFDRFRLVWSFFKSHQLFWAWSLILVNNDFDRFRLVWSFFKSHQLFWAELEEILFKPDDDGSGRIWQDALCKGRPEFVELLREIAEDIGVDLKK